MTVVVVAVRLVGHHWGCLVERLELADVINTVLGEVEVEVDGWLHGSLLLLIGVKLNGGLRSISNLVIVATHHSIGLMVLLLTTLRLSRVG